MFFFSGSILSYMYMLCFIIAPICFSPFCLPYSLTSVYGGRASLCFVFSRERVPLWGPGWPEIHYIHQLVSNCLLLLPMCRDSVCAPPPPACSVFILKEPSDVTEFISTSLVCIFKIQYVFLISVLLCKIGNLITPKYHKNCQFAGSFLPNLIKCPECCLCPFYFLVVPLLNSVLWETLLGCSVSVLAEQLPVLADSFCCQQLG